MCFQRAQCSYEIDVCEIFNLDFFFKFVDSEFKTKLFAVFKVKIKYNLKIIITFVK